MKANEHVQMYMYLPVMVFILPYKNVLASESLDEIIWSVTINFYNYGSIC